MRKRSLTLLLVLALLLLGIEAGPARGYVVPVIDPAHIVQSYILQYGALAQHILAYYQRVEQLYRQYQQLVTMYKNLESFRAGGSFLGAAGLITGLDDLIQGTQNILPGYRRYETVFTEHFPGTKLPVHYPIEELKRLRDLRQSFYYVGQSIKRLAAADPGATSILGKAITASKAADGQLEELEAGNMIASVAASEATRSVRSIELLTAALSLQASYETQQRTTAQQLQTNWLTSVPPPALGYDPNAAGYRPIPPGFGGTSPF